MGGEGRGEAAAGERGREEAVGFERAGSPSHLPRGDAEWRCGIALDLEQHHAAERREGLEVQRLVWRRVDRRGRGAARGTGAR